MILPKQCLPVARGVVGLAVREKKALSALVSPARFSTGLSRSIGGGSLGGFICDLIPWLPWCLPPSDACGCVCTPSGCGACFCDPPGGECPPECGPETFAP